jgi:hypothetical protein
MNGALPLTLQVGDGFSKPGDEISVKSSFLERLAMRRSPY